jgi:hypothetical protein
MPKFSKLQSLQVVIEQFIEAAVDDLEHRKLKPRNRRAKYLFSVPLLLTGMGGLRQAAGSVVEALVPTLEELADRYCVDLVLIVVEESVYSMVQTFRKRHSVKTRFHQLHAADKVKAEELALLGEKGLLSLFVGAGVSVGAGLPTWGALLEEIAKEAALSKEDTDRLWTLGFLDQAQFLAGRLGSSQKLREIIVKQVKSDGFSLSHAMLAMLPVESMVTTNYDTLLESACRSAKPDQQPSVLPYDSKKGGRFLLKLHGCRTHPEDIVLTRHDYLHFDSQRQALGSIVQTTMIRTHMLFIGFSLIDDNYIRLKEAVRQVSSSNRNGTALFLFANAFESDLNQTLNIHAMVPPLPPGEREGLHAGPAARKLEIFLDYLQMSCCSTTSHLLDSSFASILNPEEREFSQILNGVLNDTPHTVRVTPAFRKLREFVEETFGAPKDSSTTIIEAPLLIKNNLRFGKLIKRIQTTYVLDNVQVYGPDGVKVLKERNVSKGYPNEKEKVSDLFEENSVVFLTGDSYLKQHKSNVGFTYKMGQRERVSFHFRLHFKEPDSPRTKQKSKRDRTICSFFKAGACRNGYNCTLRHVGLVNHDEQRNKSEPLPESELTHQHLKLMVDPSERKDSGVPSTAANRAVFLEELMARSREEEEKEQPQQMQMQVQVQVEDAEHAHLREQEAQEEEQALQQHYEHAAFVVGGVVNVKGIEK